MGGNKYKRTPFVNHTDSPLTLNWHPQQLDTYTAAALTMALIGSLLRVSNEYRIVEKFLLALPNLPALLFRFGYCCPLHGGYWSWMIWILSKLNYPRGSPRFSNIVAYCFLNLKNFWLLCRSALTFSTANGRPFIDWPYNRQRISAYIFAF